MNHQSTKHETLAIKALETEEDDEEYDEEEEGSEEAADLNYQDVVGNLKGIVDTEKNALGKLEQDNEVLRGINDKAKIQEFNANYQVAPQKTNRKEVIGDEKRIYRLTQQNQVLSEKLQIINH